MSKKCKNAAYLLGYAWGKCSSLFFTTSLKYIFSAVLPLVGIVGLGSVVDALVSGKTAGEVRVTVVVYLSISLAVNLLKTAITYIDNIVMRKASDITQLDYMSDCVFINYHYAEDGSILDLKNKSLGANPVWFLDSLFKLLFYLVQFAGVAYLFALLSPWFIAVIALTSSVSVALNFKKQKSDFDYANSQVPANRKLEYLYRVMSDYAYAKDIRVGQASEFLSGKYLSALKRQISRLRVLSRKKLCLDMTSCVITVVQSVAMYGFFSYQASAGEISIAEYTVLVSGATLLLSALFGFFDCAGRINQTLSYTDLFREYRQKVADNSNISLENQNGKLKVSRQSPKIMFSHVSFSYPGSDKLILKDINFTIEPGEKIGVVGLNGSGKTTLIKLLCRLYDPTEGVITIDGVDIKTLPHGEYIKHLGVVLQDFCLFAYSVRENIVFDNPPDGEKLVQAISKAGLGGKIAGLPAGLETAIYKALDDSGVEFSGGEGQKLAIARAIYKNAGVMILDEPTSTLDPIAEYELFSRLSDISGNKTTLFISHRLSSTRFCDRIFVLSNGVIAESGSHKSLINSGGIYSDMFASQAKYYEKAGDKF